MFDSKQPTEAGDYSPKTKTSLPYREGHAISLPVSNDNSPRADANRGKPPTPPRSESTLSSNESNLHTPLSKTGVARFTYPISTLPKLVKLNVRIQLRSKEDINSKKLRYRALQEFLTDPKFREVKSDCAIHVRFRQTDPEQGDREDRFDYIILAVPDQEDDPIRFVEGFEFPQRQVLKATKFVANYCEEKEVVCTIKGDPELIPYPEHLYRECLDLLMRTRFSIDLDHSAHRSLCHVKKDFLKPLPGEILRHQSDKLEDVLVSRPLDRFSTVKQKLQYIPDLHIAHPDELHLNVNVLPYIQTRCAADVLFDLLGSNILGSGLQQHLSDIKKILTGLHVQCEYFSDEKFNETGTQSKTIDSPEWTPAPKTGRKAVIKEIRLHKDVENFLKEGSDEKPTPYSVTKYFNEGKHWKLSRRCSNY